MEHKRNIAEKKIAGEIFIVGSSSAEVGDAVKEKNAAAGPMMSLALQRDKDLQCSWSLLFPSMLIS